MQGIQTGKWPTIDANPFYVVCPVSPLRGVRQVSQTLVSHYQGPLLLTSFGWIGAPGFVCVWGSLSNAKAVFPPAVIDTKQGAPPTHLLLSILARFAIARMCFLCCSDRRWRQGMAGACVVSLTGSKRLDIHRIYQAMSERMMWIPGDRLICGCRCGTGRKRCD